MPDTLDPAIANAAKRKYFDDIPGAQLPILGTDSGSPTTPVQTQPGQMQALGGTPSLSDYGDYDPSYEAAMQGYTQQENDVNSQYTQALNQLNTNYQAQIPGLQQQHSDALENLMAQMAQQGILRSSNTAFGQGRLDNAYQQQLGGLALQKQNSSEDMARQLGSYLSQIQQGRLQAGGSHSQFLSDKANQRAQQQAAENAAKQAQQQQEQQNQQTLQQNNLTVTPTGQIVPAAPDQGIANEGMPGQGSHMPGAIIYTGPTGQEPTPWQPSPPVADVPANVVGYQTPQMNNGAFNNNELASVVSNPRLAAAFGIQYQEPPADTPIGALPWNVGKPSEEVYNAEPKWQQLGFADEGSYNVAMDPNSHVQLLLQSLNDMLGRNDYMADRSAKRALNAAMGNQNGFYPGGVFDTQLFEPIRRRLGL